MLVKFKPRRVGGLLISNKIFKKTIGNQKSIALSQYASIGQDNLCFLFSVYETKISLETKILALRILQRYMKIKHYSDSVVGSLQFYILAAIALALKITHQGGEIIENRKFEKYTCFKYSGAQIA